MSAPDGDAAAAPEPARERPEAEAEDAPPAKRSKPNVKDIFLRGGPKKELAPGQLFSGAADVPVLLGRLDALQAAWELAHAPGARAVSFGVWPPGDSLADVLLKRGKGWQAFGQHSGTRTLLYPEEALFLMESDRLVCYPSASARSPMTLHAAYAATAAAGVTHEHYAAFAHLCRMGFVVRRRGVPWCLDRRGWAHAAWEEEALERADAQQADGGAPPADAAAPQPPEWDEAAGGAEEGDDWAEGDVAAAADAPPEPPAADAPGDDAAGDAAAPAGPSRGWWPACAWEEHAGAAAAFAAALVVEEEPPVPPVAAPSALPGAAAAGAPELVYDVWPPRSTFNKRHAGRPAFRLCICTARPPNSAELAAMTAASAPVPIKSVIVRPGMFVGFDVSLSLAMQR